MPLTNVELALAGGRLAGLVELEGDGVAARRGQGYGVGEGVGGGAIPQRPVEVVVVGVVDGWRAEADVGPSALVVSSPKQSRGSPTRLFHFAR